VVASELLRDDKEQVLARIRAALRSSADAVGETGDHVYLHTAAAAPEETVALFLQRAADHGSLVQRVDTGAERAAIAHTLERRGVRRLVIPADLPSGWIPEGIELLSDAGGALSYAALDASDGVLTGCALAIAQTGTLVLDGGAAQGRRALTLLPDYHLCVVRARQIVGLVPEAIRQLASGARQGHQPITFISGPSATSDIEFDRVEGVHGPRTLDILVVG
jgi:L-lactate dehydrogenase complex protein LldG